MCNSMIEAKISSEKEHSKFKFKIDKFVSRFNRLEREPREVFLAILVGLFAGFGVYLLRQGIILVYLVLINFPLYVYEHFLSSYFPNNLNDYMIIFVILFSVTAGGAIVGYLNIKFPPIKGDHGIPQVINAVENNQGKLPYKYAFIGLLKSSITIGSAGAAGREGPVVQIGGGVGSAVGRFFRVTPEERKILIMAGVAGGISATFNAPIGGLMFSFELFRRGDRSPRLLPLLVSSVVGSTVIQLLIGQSPFLDFTDYSNYNPNVSNFLYFVLMGVILGIVSVIWILGFHIIADFFENKKMNSILKSAIGGFTLGIIYIGVLVINTLMSGSDIIQLPIWIDLPNNMVFPKYLGNALDAMNTQLANQVDLSNVGITMFIAITIFVVALIGNGITLGSGGSGGQLAPTFLMGLMLGVVFESILVWFNSKGIYVFGINTGLLVVLAMAAFFAGSTRLPMTSIILTAELVGDFKITIPLMATVATAWMVSRAIYKEDLFSISLKHKGIISDEDDISEYLQDLPVKEIMTTDVLSVHPKDRVEQVIDLMHETGHNGFPVVENDELVGIITTHDFLTALQSGVSTKELYVSSCAVMDHVVSVVPECPIIEAIIIMNSRHINRLPVVEGGSSHKVVGLVTRADLNRASLKFGVTARYNRFEEELFDSDFLVQLDKAKKSSS